MTRTPATHPSERFEVLRLQNESLMVSVYPQLGGKIRDVIDLRTGRNWLWRNPVLPLRTPQRGLNYDRQLDSGGWDEILFSVRPCTVALEGGGRMAVEDHGALVAIPWQVLDVSPDQQGGASLQMQAEGSEPPFRFRRRLTLHARKAIMRLEYQLSNEGDQAWPWLWCAHPLLAVEDGMSLKIGCPQGEPATSALWNGGKLAKADCWPWIESAESGRVNLESVFSDPGDPASFLAKVFVRATGMARVFCANSGESFTLNWDPVQMPWMGLWINKRSWSGVGDEPYFNLGLEPSTVPVDGLDVAIEHGLASILQPGQECQWALDLSLEHEGEHDG